MVSVIAGVPVNMAGIFVPRIEGSEIQKEVHIAELRVLCGFLGVSSVKKWIFGNRDAVCRNLGKL